MGFAKSALAQERLVIPENDFMPSISIHWGLSLGAQPIWPSIKYGNTAAIGPVYTGVKIGFGGLSAGWGSTSYYVGLTLLGATVDYSWSAASNGIGAAYHTVQSQNLIIGIKLYDGRFGSYFLLTIWFRTGIMLDYEITHGNKRMYENNDYPKRGDRFLTYELFYSGPINDYIYSDEVKEISWW
jgi:hypothetical protein